MANEKNLIPNSKRTPSERRENAKKAGKKSGEARRRKKLLKNCMLELLELPVSDKKQIKELTKIGINPEDINNQSLLTTALFMKGVSGDVGAFKEIRNLIGESNIEDNNENEIRIVDDI